MFPRNVYADEGSDLEVIGINELDALNATLTVQMVSTDGETVFSEEIETAWRSGRLPTL